MSWKWLGYKSFLKLKAANCPRTSIDYWGVVATLRFALSISRKPFHSYEFHHAMCDAILAYLDLFPAHTEESFGK